MQILRDVKEEHKVVIVVTRQNDSSYILYLVVAGLPVVVAFCQLKSVNVFSSLDVDSVLICIVVTSGADYPELLRALSVHDDLVRRFELRFDLRRHNF